MKQLVVLMLVAALAVPALADVAVTATGSGNGVLTITVTPSGGAGIRGVALKLTRASGDATVANETKVTTTGLNTFIDYGFSVPIGFNVGVGHAAANPTAAGVATFPATDLSLCAGYLDQGGNQAALTTAATFTVDYDGTTNTTINIALDTLRGGIVGDNLGTITVQGSQLLTFAVPETLNGTLVINKTTAAPAIATHVNGGRTETFVLSGVTASQGGQIEYYVDWGDGNNTGWVTATNLNKVYTYTAAGTYTVTAKARPASNPTAEVNAAPLTLTREAYKSTAPAYATWADFGRPNCWAFQRNCRGDANGTSSGFGANVVWVNSADLTIFGSAYNKVVATLKTVPNGICADNNRASTGFGANVVWVNSADLTTFSTYYNKIVANVPVCGLGNLHFYTN